jgi:tRNA A37 threonylcarbamoyltransferase TsaD
MEKLKYCPILYLAKKIVHKKFGGVVPELAARAHC